MTRDSSSRELVDVSIVLGVGTAEWPGDTPYSCGWTATIAEGSSVNLSAFTMSPHVGTHADAPLHVRVGAPASEALPLGAFVGRAALVDVSQATGEISHDALAAFARESGLSLAGVERLLLRTGRTIADGTFPDEWPALSAECMNVLAAGGLRLLGVDAPSVDQRDSKELAVHHALFAGGAFNLENLDLREAHVGWHELIAPPLRLVGLDAAPVRAVLRAVGA